MESPFILSKLLTFLDYFLYLINFLEDIIWSYIGTPLILTVGSVLTLKNFFPQIRKFPAILKFFFHSLFTKEEYEIQQQKYQEMYDKIIVPIYKTIKEKHL
jgi:Na+/alanine symporter